MRGTGTQHILTSRYNSVCSSKLQDGTVPRPAGVGLTTKPASGADGGPGSADLPKFNQIIASWPMLNTKVNPEAGQTPNHISQHATDCN